MTALFQPGDKIAVRKLNLAGEQTWLYYGRIVQADETLIILEAAFDRDDIPFHGILLRKGDRFVERFYTDRWYNIFAIHDLDDDHVKGWYCNIAYPAQFAPGEVSYRDLALDLLVYPDGSDLLLDEDEFAAQELSLADRELAWQALDELRAEMKLLVAAWA